MLALAEELRTAIEIPGAPTAVRRGGDVAVALRRMLRRLAIDAPARPDLPPFRYNPGMPAAATGRALAGMHRRLHAHGPGLPGLLAAAFDRLGLGPTVPERRLAMLGAVLAHTTPAPPFHDARHTREVVADAIWLAAATPAPLRPDRALLLLAATIHDLGHDGGTNTRADARGRTRAIPFLLEDRSLALMQPAAAGLGLGRARWQDLVAVVRATDIGFRPALTALHDGLPGAAAALPAELARLARRGGARLVAALLADADVMASAGLTAASHRARSARLGAERGQKLTAADTLGFLEGLLGGRFISAAGRQLDANIETLRRGARCPSVGAGPGKGTAHAG